MVPGFDIIDNIYNKDNLLNLAKGLNVPIPKTFYFSTILDTEKYDIKYPILTKGKTGLDFYKKLKRKVFFSRNKQELIKNLEFISNKIPLKDTFSQEFIPFTGKNKTISLAAFCINGEIKTFWMGVKLREHPIQFGTATYTESIYEDDCLEHSKKLIKKLNYSGVCEIEFLKDSRDNQFKLIEINARTWLWVGHAIANGINFPLYIYNYLNDINTSYPEGYQLGLKWRNPISDLIFSLQAFIKGKSPRIYIKTRDKTINALCDPMDKRPFFKYVQLIIRFLRNR
jgi:predicted ATP-grasp superfamily ATP-dependent carboligase